LRTTKKRVPSGVSKEEFSQIIFEKIFRVHGVLCKSSINALGSLLGEMRRGAGTYDDPCRLERGLDSAFMQARVRLNLLRAWSLF